MPTTPESPAVERALAAYGAEAEVYRRSGAWTDQTIVEMFQGWAERQPDAFAVSTIEGALTYGELDRRSDAVALGLVEAGLSPGSPVLFQMGNELETVVTYYGVLKAGAVPVCSIPNHRLHEMRHIAEACGAAGHVYQGDYRNYDLEGLSAALASHCPEIGVRVAARGRAPEGVLSLEAIVETADPKRAREVVDAVQREVAAEDLAIFQLSGGTTGIPKVIPHTHETYLSIAARWTAGLRWDEQSINLHFIPLMHHAGLGTFMTPTHFAGGNMVLGRAVDAKLMVELIEQYRVTCSHFNVVAAQPLLDYSAQVDCDFSSITHFICTWGPMRPELAAEMEDLFGAPGLGSFGMGEGVHLYALRDDPIEIRRHTLGSTIGPHDEVVVRHPGTDEEVPHGEMGELTFRGPSVIRSYLDPEHSATGFTDDGFLRSGDLGKAHVFGDRICYTLEGRIKDQISRGGEKFMATELEALLVRHPEVREVAAFGVPDARLGERVCVAVVPEPAAGSTDPEELRLRLVEFLDLRDVAKFKWPERIMVLDELPKPRDGGKVQKHVLRDRATSESTGVQ